MGAICCDRTGGSEELGGTEKGMERRRQTVVVVVVVVGGGQRTDQEPASAVQWPRLSVSIIIISSSIDVICWAQDAASAS